MIPIAKRIADELQVRVSQVEAAIALLDDKATVPVHRPLPQGSHRRARRHAAAHARRAAGLPARARGAARGDPQEHRGAGQADAGARGARSRDADTKARLEDLYLPYKPKRRTQGADRPRSRPRAAGAGAAAGSDARARSRRPPPTSTPDKGVADAAAALEGARWILMETFAEDAELVGGLRAAAVGPRRVASTVVAGQGRGRRQVLRLLQRQRAGEAASRRTARSRCCAAARKASSASPSCCRTPKAPPARPSPSGASPARAGIEQQGRPADAWLAETVRWTWKVKLLRAPRARDRAAAARAGRSRSDPRVRPQPARPAARRAGRTARRRWGSIPGIRTGVKVAVVDGTGKLLDTATIYPHEPRKDWEGALRTLARALRARTACSSSRSATAPRRARPTSSPAI